MSYALSVTVDRPFDVVVEEVRAALAEQGFGVVSEIDMRKTLRTKIGVEIDAQLILGACAPHFAHRSLQAEPSIGVLLPCNVVVRATDAGTVVETIDPRTMVELTANPEIAQIAAEVTGKLEAALAAVSAAGRPVG
ncbi:MAG TPA: DUF302 domain-containing protein [Actinotalea sp.]|nr:DUF302 domain-containing protein [Actinotalea sp.]